MPPMAEPPLDVLAIGNAIVDVIATTDEAFLGSEGLVKGSMRLIDAEEATRLYGRMAPGRETSGGSAANTAAGVAAMGCRAGFIGRVAPAQLRSEAHTSELQSIMRISYAVFCFKKKNLKHILS